MAAVAASKPMAEVEWGSVEAGDLRSMAEAQLQRVGGDELPLAAALALVLLASWGVLLVTRGRVRRGVAGLALLSAVALLAATWFGYPGLEDGIRDDLAPMLGEQDGELPIQRTGWFWTLLVAALLGVLASAAALRWAPAWPEMGSRYDAPSGAAEADGTSGETAEPDNLDLWKSLDEGRDPTA
jgi:uncharacterized membrane protein (TIGR02234 family)